jgi:hypothetical protein
VPMVSQSDRVLTRASAPNARSGAVRPHADRQVCAGVVLQSPVAFAGVAGGGSSSGSLRYPAIDVLRGLALISMVSAHLDDLHQSTFVARVLHSAHWIDGAFFFVALSGVVTGLVHRRVVHRSGFHASASKLVRRAGWLYLVHIALAVAIVAAYNADPSNPVPATPTWGQAGGVGSAVERIVALRLEPNFNAVLPMYVALLLWAVAAVSLLRLNRWWAVAGISVAVYAFGQTVNGLAITEAAFPVADWQLLFTAGLLVGWFWEHERGLIGRRWRRAAVGGSAVVAGVLFVSARTMQGPMESVFGNALQRANGGWLAFVFAGSVLVTGYTLIEAARRSRRLARILRPLEILGSKGLPGYAAMVVTIIVLHTLPHVPRNDLTLIAVTVVCGAAEYGSVRFAGRRPQGVSQPITRVLPVPSMLLPDTDPGLANIVRRRDTTSAAPRQHCGSRRIESSYDRADYRPADPIALGPRQSRN